MWLLLALPACWTPRTTSDTGMTGVVVDDGGVPVIGTSVETVEAASVTAPDGRFAVSFKAPTQFVRFTHDDVQFERHLQPDDHGKDVQIKLPALATRTVYCDADVVCQASMSWDLGGGLKAKARVACDPSERTVRVVAPAEGLPAEASCTIDPTQPDLPLRPLPKGEAVRLAPPPVPFKVQLVADAAEAQTPPQRCQLQADHEPMTGSGEGVYTAQVFGVTLITGDCDGVPFAPTPFIVRKPASAEVHWFRNTPRVDLSDEIKGLDSILFSSYDDGRRRWSLSVAAQPDGTFIVPRLPAGFYLIGIRMTLEQLQLNSPVLTLEPDIVHLTDDPFIPRATVGVLRLTAPRDAGTLRAVYTTNAPRAQASP